MVMNYGTGPANITIEFYDQAGTKVLTHTPAGTVAPGTSLSLYTPSITGLPAGFIGSAVVTSDQPVGAIINTATPQSAGLDPSDPFRIGTSSGVDSAATGTTLYFPQVERNFYGWNSTMYIQLAGSSPAQVNVQFINRDGSPKWTTSATLQPNAAVTFNQQDQTSLGDGWLGSAVVTSSAPMAGIANLFDSNSSPLHSTFYSYNAFTSGATKLYMPRLVKNYYSYSSGFAIQNIGTAATTVTVEYYMGAVQGTVKHSTVIQPNQAWQVYMGNPNAIPAGLPDTFGSAIVTSSGQPIVANINEVFAGDPSNVQAGFGYSFAATLEGQQTSTVLLPKVSSKYAGYSTGFSIQNVGTSTANMTATFVGRDGRTTTLNSGPVAPGAVWAKYLPSIMPTWLNFDGSATITSTGGQPIIGMAIQAYRPDSYAAGEPAPAPMFGDSNSAYNGTNK
jgi:hypothetical protein